MAGVLKKKTQGKRSRFDYDNTRVISSSYHAVPLWYRLIGFSVLALAGSFVSFVASLLYCMLKFYWQIKM